MTDISIIQRIQYLARLWCKWNCKEMDGGDFALAFERTFKSECMAAWNGPTMGDSSVYRLSEAYFRAAHPKGIGEDKARNRRFQIMKALPYDCFKVRRLDLKSGRIESYHKSFLVLEGG